MRRVNLWFALLALLLVAFALRVFRLDFQSLWYDEAFSVYLAHMSLADITTRTAADIQPPLYYYLLHFWIVLAGDNEFVVRFPSLFFGILTLPLMFVTARQLFDRSTGLLAASLTTLAPLYLWYSQETRMYTQITFLLLLSNYALLRALLVQLQPTLKAIGFTTSLNSSRMARSKPMNSSQAALAIPSSGQKEADEGGTSPRRTVRWWVVFVLANVAAVYTHYFALVVLAFQLLYLMVSSFRFEGFRAERLRLITWKSGAISIFIVLLAFLPWAPLVLVRFGQDASYWRGALKVDEALRHILINFTMGESVLEAQAQWLAAGWLAVLLVGTLAFAAKARGKSQDAKVGTGSSTSNALLFSLLYLLVPLGLLLVLFYRNPKFNPRYLMIASPPFFLLLAAGLDSLLSLAQRTSAWVRGVAIALCLLPLTFVLATSAYADSNAYFDPAFTKASFRDIARYIDDHIQPDEAVILTSGHLFPAFNYYFRGDIPQIRLPDDPTLNADHILGFDAAHVLNETLAGKRGVWVVLWQDEVVDPNGFIPMLLSSRGQEQKIQGTSFYQVRLRHWVLPPNVSFATEPQPATPRVANLQNKVKLLGYDAPAPTPADVGASFNLYWQALDEFGETEDYQVALRMRDAAGNLWGKQDRRPAGYTYPTMRWKKDENLVGTYTVPLAAGAPAGDYFVELTLYTASNPSGLDVLAPNGAPMGRSVKLGPIPVLPATKPATLTALDIQNTISQPLGPFTLLGFQLARDKASAGESIPLILFWRADAKPDRDYTFRVQFGDTTSDPLPIANQQYSTSKWRAGEIVRGQYAVGIPATAKDGATALRVVLSDGKELELAPFTIEKTDRVFVKPAMPFSQNVTFGNNYLALAGYDPPSTVKPGDTLKMTLFWQALSKMDKAYTVFVHVLDKDNKIVTQRDAQPAGGARPTTGWVANEYIADTFELAIKPDTLPGEYKIEIGWYDASDYSRLQVLDDSGAPAGDHVILTGSLIVR